MPGDGSREETAAQRRTTVTSIAAAALLVILKLGTGLITGSLGLISSGVESSGDVAAAVLTFFAVRLGVRPADFGHPYGHRRAENLGSLGEAGILLAGGLFVGVEAVRRLIAGSHAPDTGWYVFVVMGTALLVDLFRTLTSIRTSRRYRSPALRSNAFHFAGDMAGSVAVIGGLAAARAGYARGDAVAAAIVAAIVLAAALKLISENANVLMDRTPSEARDVAERAIGALGPGIELNRLRMRESAGRFYADVVVGVPPGQAVVEGHQAADMVEQAVRQALPTSDVVVHVEPRRHGLDLRDQVLAIALSQPQVREAHDITVFQQNGSASVSLHLKFGPEISLVDAHRVAEIVERAIRELAHVDDVQTHLEPLEQPVPAGPPDRRAEREVTAEVHKLVDDYPGIERRRVKLIPTEAGQVLFLTVGVAPSTSLSEAHRAASELEETLRSRIRDLLDVVVHTEP